MTLFELLQCTPWAAVQAALLRKADKKIPVLAYQALMEQLKRMQPHPNPMRIAVEPERMPFNAAEPELQVVGRDGSLNKHMADWKECGAPADYDDEEATFSLSFKRWEEWLGMVVEPETLRSMRSEDIVAYVLEDMTFYGFTQDRIADALEEIRLQIDRFDSMTPDERKRSSSSVVEVMVSLRERFPR